MSESSPIHDDDIRHLIHQRIRSAKHTHSPLHSLQQFQQQYIQQQQDSPSLYSQPMFSPRTDPRPPPMPRHLDLFHPEFGRVRLDDPSQSSIDFAPDRIDDSHDRDYISDDASDDNDQSSITELGPKMRFHSPAPWEEPATEKSVQEHSYFGKMRGIGFVSPRLGISSRPSDESTRSQGRPSKSSDTSSSQSSGRDGALRSLAQASLSSTSLVSVQSSAPTHLCPKLPLPNLHSETPSHSCDPSPAPSPSNDRPYSHLRNHSYRNPSGFPFASNSSSEESFNLLDNDARSTWFQSQPTSLELSHPYANPKHALRQTTENMDEYYSTLAYDTDRLMLSVLSSTDSSATIMEPSTSVSSTSTKVANDSSISLRGHILSSVSGREISAPIPLTRKDNAATVASSSFDPEAKSPRPQIVNIPGWTERSTSPTFALISLEEARAQRTRSATAQAAMQSSGPIAFPSHTLEPIRSVEPAPPTPPRSRARSISTGARPKHSKIERRDSESAVSAQPMVATGAAAPNVKTIKHKKSGFMRIFNGRDKEKGSSSLPPVPNISTTTLNAPPPRTLMKPASITSYRVPVPSLSSPIERTSPTSIVPPPPAPVVVNTKRTPPPPIDTSYKASTLPQVVECLSARPPSIPRVPEASRSLSIGTNSSHPPQSAPPFIPEFPSLRLRPISSSFSTQFGHILTAEPEQEDPELNTPSTARSPVTPSVLSSSTSDSVKVDSVPTVDGTQDQSAIIQALQEQITSAKKAWQMQIWELEGQVKDLRAEVQEARALSSGSGDKEYCATCGRGQKPSSGVSDATKLSVLHRPRALTGGSSRFGSTR